MMVKNVLSDAGDLIFIGTAYSKKGFSKFVQERCGLSKDKIIEIYKRFRDRAYVDSSYHFHDACRDALAELGLSEHEEEYFEHVRDTDTITILPQVKETIDELISQGVGFYVASDSVFGGKHIEDLLARHGVNVTGAISSKDVGAMKPSEEFWNGALEKYGLAKDDVVFLGHAYDELSGAHEFGFLTIACFYDGEEDISFIPEERNLKEFGELPKALDLTYP
jgi:FMN phosphatase YigB (HAD superfamily)